jgi:hypothetical protein
VLCLVSLRGGINKRGVEERKGKGAQRDLGAAENFRKERTEVRRERKCQRKKKMDLSRGAANRRNRWMKEIVG